MTRSQEAAFNRRWRRRSRQIVKPPAFRPPPDYSALKPPVPRDTIPGMVPPVPRRVPDPYMLPTPTAPRLTPGPYEQMPPTLKRTPGSIRGYA